MSLCTGQTVLLRKITPKPEPMGALSGGGGPAGMGGIQLPGTPEASSAAPVRVEYVPKSQRKTGGRALALCKIVLCTLAATSSHIIFHILLYLLLFLPIYLLPFLFRYPPLPPLYLLFHLLLCLLLYLLLCPCHSRRRRTRSSAGSI